MEGLVNLLLCAKLHALGPRCGSWQLSGGNKKADLGRPDVVPVGTIPEQAARRESVSERMGPTPQGDKDLKETSLPQLENWGPGRGWSERRSLRRSCRAGEWK